MDTAQHAGRILEAWSLGVSGCFEAELENTLALCEAEAPLSELEHEQQAVLESVVRRFRQISQPTTRTSPPHQFEAGFFLLRHLRSRAA